MTTLHRSRFEDSFFAVAGYSPFPWQERLFELLADGRIPRALDVPTGLGKTSVMAIWYLARLAGASLPRRLVYVVDRRAVVDQSTEVAESIRSSAADIGGEPPAISTLRGRFIDNRQWLEDPARTAIVVGTVDMMGSRLLFEGYGVGRRMRPFHAGLLGCDTLLVLDESHLVPPFERLVEQIARRSRPDGDLGGPDAGAVPRFRLMALSATRRSDPYTGKEDGEPAFQLDADDHANSLVRDRLNASKTMQFEPADGKLEATLARHAWRLTGDGTLAKRILVYSNSRDTVDKTQAELVKLAKGDRKADTAAVEIHTELIVGARRVAERQAAAEELKASGFLANSHKQPDKPSFVLATSAGEVGIDLDADHCVMDLVTFERMVQRLGRVNRRGTGAAEVVVIDATDDLPAPMKDQAKRCGKLLRHLPLSEGSGFEANPARLTELRDGHPDLVADASTPAPLYPALGRPLVESWAMTSLEEHTGRPEVAPWLRGWVDNTPQTTLVWRSYLPVREEGAPVAPSEVDAFFAAAPPHLAEQLETETFRVRDWLTKCLRRIDKARESAGADEAMLLPATGTVAFLLDHANRALQSFTASELGEILGDKRRSERELPGKTLVLDARIGGLSEHGLLDDKAGGVVSCADAATEPPSGTGEHDTSPDRWWGREDDSAPWAPITGFRVRREKDEHDDSTMPDTKQTSAAVGRWRGVHTSVVARTTEGDVRKQLVVEAWRGQATDEASRAISSRPQSLEDHQAEVERRTGDTATRLGISEDLKDALVLAARLHDEGKKAENWQTAFRVPRAARPLAKSGSRRPPDFAILNGYRHEFGSLTYLEQDAQFAAMADDMQELVLHLVAAHHGFARPVIRTGGCTDGPPSALEARARDVALRFARLQQRYGPWGLAWLEAIVRAADQQASSALNETTTSASVESRDG